MEGNVTQKLLWVCDEKSLLILALMLYFGLDTGADDWLDTTSAVIYKIIVLYQQLSRTDDYNIVIIGAALLLVFGRMAWPAFCCAKCI